MFRCYLMEATEFDSVMWYIFQYFAINRFFNNKMKSYKSYTEPRNFFYNGRDDISAVPFIHFRFNVVYANSRIHNCSYRFAVML